MPSTVTSLLETAAVSRSGVVRWGDRVGAPPAKGPSTGIYIVALTPELRRVDATRDAAPIASGAIEVLLSRRAANLALDGAKPTPDQLQQRLAAFWLPDETVLYIGLADARTGNLAGRELRGRVRDYEKTKLGARSPHSGGWPLLTLTCLRHLHIHYAYCKNVVKAEEDCLKRFAEQVSPDSRADLHDSVVVMPFANLEYPKGTRKAHGITGARGAVPAGSRAPW